jgi:MerR family transcriptional regulator, heat shock protein HspR
MDPSPLDEPCYIISVAARIVNMHPQTLRYYERLGLIEPSRSRGKIRLYSSRDLERLKLIHSYVDDLGVNLAGVEIIINLTERMAEMEAEIKRLQDQLAAQGRPPLNDPQVDDPQVESLQIESPQRGITTSGI